MFQKPGFCRLVNEEVLADGNERVIRLWKPLRIYGHVTNAVTGQPIDDFAVIPVLRFNSGLLVAQRARSTEGHAGRFSVVVDRPDAGHVVRVDAIGFRAVMTDSYRVEQEDQECFVRLEPALPVRGVVRDSKGDSVAGAHVYLATASQHLKFYPREDDDNFWILSGEDGLFEFPAQCERYSVVVIDERGYAEVTCELNEQPGCMTLRPWAGIKGVLLQSGQPVGDESVYLTARRFTGRDSPRVNDRMRATTDGKGRFDFPRVPPIPCKVMADLSIWDDSALSSSQSVPLDLKPGLTIWVNLGAAGADVTGRAALEDRTNGQLDFSYSLNYLLRMQPAAQSPAHVAEIGFDWRNGWNDVWKSTPEGRAYCDSLHYYSVKLKPDGTFLISGVPVGEYELALNIYESPEGGCLVNPIGARKFRFRVPSDIYESSDGILNLGSISVKPVDAPRPGDLVPNFGFETPDGRKVQLSDFRGKYALLDFWAAWCGPCIAQVPSVKQIHDRFGDDGQLVVVGLNLDQDKEKAKHLVKRHAVDWPQGYLGDWTETNVPQQLGVGSIPVFLLIDPKGTLVHKSRQADDITEAINRLLLSDP